MEKGHLTEMEMNYIKLDAGPFGRYSSHRNCEGPAGLGGGGGHRRQGRH
jgi:hypothetical protein